VKFAVKFPVRIPEQFPVRNLLVDREPDRGRVRVWGRLVRSCVCRIARSVSYPPLDGRPSQPGSAKASDPGTIGWGHLDDPDRATGVSSVVRCPDDPVIDLASGIR